MWARNWGGSKEVEVTAGEAERTEGMKSRGKDMCTEGTEVPGCRESGGGERGGCRAGREMDFTQKAEGLGGQAKNSLLIFASCVD